MNAIITINSGFLSSLSFQGKIQDRIGFFPANFVQRVQHNEKIFRCIRTFIGCKEQGQITLKENQVSNALKQTYIKYHRNRVTIILTNMAIPINMSEWGHPASIHSEKIYTYPDNISVVGSKHAEQNVWKLTWWCLSTRGSVHDVIAARWGHLVPMLSSEGHRSLMWVDVPLWAPCWSPLMCGSFFLVSWEYFIVSRCCCVLQFIAFAFSHKGPSSISLFRFKVSACSLETMTFHNQGLPQAQALDISLHLIQRCLAPSCSSTIVNVAFTVVTSIPICFHPPCFILPTSLLECWQRQRDKTHTHSLALPPAGTGFPPAFLFDYSSLHVMSCILTRG